jgi:ribosomal protein S18 acetylase RimI-like enzyme
MDLSIIQARLRATVQSRGTRVGPFLIMFDAHADNPFRNYAIPDDAADPTAEEVERLVAAFTERRRTPRLEYVGRPAAVERALTAAGFTTDRLPLMTAARTDLVEPPQPAGIGLRTVESEDDLWRAAAVQQSAYGEAAPTEPDIDRLRHTVEAGGRVALAVRAGTGEGVGAGLSTRPEGGLTEIAAVGVLPAYRRRGIATAVAHCLTKAALDAGAAPFLQAEGEAEERMYARIGYRRVGELTLATRAASDPAQSTTGPGLGAA